MFIAISVKLNPITSVRYTVLVTGTELDRAVEGADIERGVGREGKVVGFEVKFIGVVLRFRYGEAPLSLLFGGQSIDDEVVVGHGHLTREQDGVLCAVVVLVVLEGLLGGEVCRLYYIFPIGIECPAIDAEVVAREIDKHGIQFIAFREARPRNGGVIVVIERQLA